MSPALAQVADPTAVRRAVEDVLSRPEFADASPGQSLLDRFIAAMFEGIGQFLARLGGAGAGGSILGGLALLLLVMLLIALATQVLRRFRRGASLDPAIHGQVGRSARDWGTEAAHHAAAGDHRQALRCRYRETLALLAAEDLVDEVPGRTTGEYLGAVSTALPAARDDFGRLTRTFEGAWYGRRPVDADTLQDALSAQARIVAAAGLRRDAVTVARAAQPSDPGAS